MIVTVVEHITIVPGGWRVVYERRDRRGEQGVIIVPQGTPGQDRLRKGATVEVTRYQGGIEIREPLASMRMEPVWGRVA